jgi:hypothetical protein
VLRWIARALLQRPWWQKLAVCLLAPLAALNLTVAFVGSSAVFPLSPFFLQEKCQALLSFAAHLPSCVWNGHADTSMLIRAAELHHHLPPGLLQAVIEVESEDSPHRISAAGAMGLAQLMPGTAAQLDVDDPFDSKAAIDAGARYLASNLRRTRDVRLAVAAYNAGPGAVDDGVMPRNGQTQQYVAKVMKTLWRHHAAHARPGARR